MHSSTDLISNVSGSTANYSVVDLLPTGFRSYDVKELYVRGLYFDESLTMAQLVGGFDAKWRDLINIYSDAIRGIDLRKLEPIDLVILIQFSSIYTVSKNGWVVNMKCNHKDEDGNLCGHEYQSKFDIDSFEFNDPTLKLGNIPYTLQGKDVKIGPVTVGDMIDKERYLQDNPEVKSLIVDYACLIKDDLTLDEKVKMIRFSTNEEINNLAEIDQDFNIVVQPISVRCPQCGKTSHVDVNLEKIRSYP